MRVITDCYSIRADARPGAVPTPELPGRDYTLAELTDIERRVWTAHRAAARDGEPDIGARKLSQRMELADAYISRALGTLRACGLLPPSPLGTRDEAAMTPAERADYLARLFLLRTAKRAKMARGAGDELTPDEMNRALGEAS